MAAPQKEVCAARFRKALGKRGLTFIEESDKMRRILPLGSRRGVFYARLKHRIRMVCRLHHTYTPFVSRSLMTSSPIRSTL